MTAYIIVDFTVTDPDKLKQYGAMAAETLIPFGGEFLVKRAVDCLHGDQGYGTKVILGFPDRESAAGWYNSPAYQAIIDLRNQGMTSDFHLVG